MLYTIEEFPDIYCDACLRDSEGKLMFLSVYGRDGVLMQMLSALELGAPTGVTAMHLVNPEGARHTVLIGDTKRLGKFAAKLPDSLFGQLKQTWVYDKALQEPDRANRIGFVLSHSAAGAPVDSSDAAWKLIRELSPVALHDKWKEPILDWCRSRSALEEVSKVTTEPLGSVRAWRVSLTDHFLAFISRGVRERTLRLGA